MKRVFVLLISLFFIVCAQNSIASESEFIIRVEGTKGMRFMGNYSIMQANGTSVSKSVEGKVPARYRVRGAFVSAVFMKKSKKGELVVAILRDNNEISRSDTSAEYGGVSIATN